MKRSQGFTLVEMMIALAIVGLVIYMSSGTIVAFAQREKMAKNSAKLMKLQASLMAMIRDESSWQASIDANGAGGQAFACWVNGTACPGGAAAFVPRQSDGSLFGGTYNPNNASAGFDLEGNPCTTFNAANPDPNCPYRFTFTRTFSCAGPYVADCIKPSMVVQMVFDRSVLDALNDRVVNLDINLLSVPIQKKGSSKTVTPTSCPPGQAVNRVMWDGSVECLDWALLGG